MSGLRRGVVAQIPTGPSPSGVLGLFNESDNNVAGVTSLASDLSVTCNGYMTFCNGGSWSSIANGLAGAGFSGTLPAGANLLLSVNMCPDTAGISAVAAHLSTFTTLAEGLPNGTICRIGWEFDGAYGVYTFPWGPSAASGNTGAPAVTVGNSPSTYVTAYQQIVTTMRAANPTLKFDWCCNTGSSPDVSTLETYYPGDAYVDFIGGDHYDTTSGSPNDFSAFGPVVNLAALRGKPVSSSEWGLNTREDTTFIDNGAQFFLDTSAAAIRYSFPPYTIGYQAYFNGENSVLSDYPDSEAQYTADFG